MARAMGHRLLTKADILVFLTQVVTQLAKKAEVSTERTIHELARIGFSRLRDVVEWGPDQLHVKPLDGLSENAASAVAMIEV